MPVDIKRHSPSHTPPPMPVIPHREPASHGISLTLTIILMILAAIVSGGSVYYGQKSTLESESQDLKSQITSLQQQLAQTPQQQLPVPTPTTVASVAPSASPSPVTTNNFDITLAKVGDKVASMTIKAIEPFDKSKGVVSNDNAKVTFSGEVTLTGTYTYNAVGVLQNKVCLDDFDQTSLAKLPVMDGDARTVSLCFSNDSTAQKLLGPKGSTGTATVVINKYIINSAATETTNTAELIKVVSKK